MVLTNEQKRVRDLLTETVTLLCKNGLHFNSELGIEALIGITLDKEEVFLVSIKEIINSDGKTLSDSLVNFGSTEDVAAKFESTPAPQTFQSAENIRGTGQSFCIQKRGRKHYKNSAYKAMPAAIYNNHKNGSVIKSEAEEEIFSYNISEPPLKSYRTEASSHKLPVSEIEIKNSFSISSDSLTSKTTEVVTEHTRCSDQGLESQISNDSCMIEIKEENSDEVNPYVVIDSLYTNSVHDLNGWNWKPTYESPMQLLEKTSSDDRMVSEIRQQKSRARHTFANEKMCTGKPDESDARRCPICGAVSQNWNLYLRHIRKHQPGLYRCPFCGKSFSGSTNLRGHLALHTNVREFACHLCEKAYAYKKDLSEHLVLKHGHLLARQDLLLNSDPAGRLDQESIVILGEGEKS